MHRPKAFSAKLSSSCPLTMRKKRWRRRWRRNYQQEQDRRQIILVDDASRDQTAHKARSLGLTVIEHVQNRGYGANQKTCYREALRRGADVVVMIHPDHQYDCRVVPRILQSHSLN